MAAGDMIIMVDDILCAPGRHRRFFPLGIEAELCAERGQRLRTVAMVLSVIVFCEEDFLDLCRQACVTFFVFSLTEHLGGLRHDAEAIIIIGG